MVLGKLPVPGRPTNLDYSRARAYCACSRCGWGCLDIFSLIYLFSFNSPSEILSQRAVKPKTTNQHTNPCISETLHILYKNLIWRQF